MGWKGHSVAVDELGLANVNEGVFWLLLHRMIDFEHSFGPSPMPESTFIRPSGQSTYDKLARHSALSHWQRQRGVYSCLVVATSQVYKVYLSELEILQVSSGTDKRWLLKI